MSPDRTPPDRDPPDGEHADGQHADGQHSDGDPRESEPQSELGAGLDHLGRAVGGVLTRLLGPRYTQVELDPQTPVLGAEADAAVERAGAVMGRWLNAAGDGLRSHPTDPLAALDHAARHREDEPSLREGEAPLAAGVRALAGGLFRSTEAVLDKVAPRRPKQPQGEGAGADATDDPDHPEAGQAPGGETTDDERSLG